MNQNEKHLDWRMLHKTAYIRSYMRHLLSIFLCGMACSLSASDDIRFTENGIVYAPLSYAASRYIDRDGDSSYVKIDGYENDSLFCDGKSLRVAASIVHDGKQYWVKEIGKYGLAGLPNMESIFIEQGIEVIADYAFAYCPHLRSAYIPASVKRVETELFYACPMMKELIVDAGNKRYDSRDNANAIIDSNNNTLCVACNGTHIPQSVESVSEFAFHGCDAMDSVVVSEGVTSIGYSAFLGCRSLRYISLPTSLVTVGTDAFENCISLDSIYIPEGVCAIRGGNPFAGCIRLSSVRVAEGNKEYYSAPGCNGIVCREDSTLVATCPATIMSPDVRKLGRHCFRGTNIHSFTLPTTIMEFSAESFYECYEIDSLTVAPSHPTYMSPEGSNSIITRDGKCLVLGCRTTRLPEGVERIGDEAFRGRYAGSLLKLPMGVKEIGKHAFSECPQISSIAIPPTVMTIQDGAFAFCPNLVSISIPEGVRIISSCAFEGCKSLISVHLPSTVESVSSDAFRGCPCEESVKRNLEQRLKRQETLLDKH